jgi:hypothetical protein
MTPLKDSSLQLTHDTLEATLDMFRKTFSIKEFFVAILEHSPCSKSLLERDVNSPWTDNMSAQMAVITA